VKSGSASEWGIETVNLTKRFGAQTAVHALDLRVPRGTVFGFLGPNGAGKTTTIRMLMNTLSITEGAARLLGEDVRNQSTQFRQRIGYVPELHQIYRWMRVHEVLWFSRKLFASWNDSLARELLQSFRLDSNKQVRQLSKGTQAKLSLLVALAHEPEVLILDEPTSGLDPIVREELLDGALRTLCDRAVTVLFSSHGLADVCRLADSIGIIREGRLLTHQSTDDLLRRTKRVRVVLDDDRMPAIPRGTIRQERRHREWVLTVGDFKSDTLAELRGATAGTSIRVDDLSLEEVFKDYVLGDLLPC
jgi:ABC-2 type transport system ATP-binding protein